MRAKPAAERCERPDSAPASTAGDHPGRFAHGPDEKHGLTGRRFGFITMCSSKVRGRKLMEPGFARQCGRRARAVCHLIELETCCLCAARQQMLFHYMISAA
jgi:hypothetical protein